MNNYFFYTIKMICYIIIAFIFSLFLPWWVISIIGVFIGFHATTYRKAIFESVLTLLLSWAIMLVNNLFIQDYVILEKINIFLGLSSLGLIIITLIIPVLIGFVSAIFGYQLKEVVKYEK